MSAVGKTTWDQLLRPVDVNPLGWSVNRFDVAKDYDGVECVKRADTKTRPALPPPMSPIPRLFGPQKGRLGTLFGTRTAAVPGETIVEIRCEKWSRTDERNA